MANNDQFYVHVPGSCPCGLAHSVQGADELNAQQGLVPDYAGDEAATGIYDRIVSPSAEGPDPLTPRPTKGGRK